MASNALCFLLPFLLHAFISNVVCLEFSPQFNLSGDKENYNHVMAANTACELRELDHFILALRWMPSICSKEKAERCKTPVPTHIVIHGLWSVDQYGANVVYCGEDNFNLFDNRSTDPTTEFFAQEWHMHGSCSGLSQANYFGTSLELHEKENLLDRLKGLGFGPHPTKAYNPSEIIAAYYDKYKVVMKILCVKKSSSPLVEQIAEFHFRVNKDTKTIESITGDSNLCETTNVQFPDKYYSL
ncbi:ribonuclease T2 [Ranunculus cassubicifolius]